MQNKNKDFLGKGKYGNFGHIRCWIRTENLPTDKDFINIVVKPMKAVDDKGHSHAVVIDTFEPNKKQRQDGGKPQTDTEDLPF